MKMRYWKRLFVDGESVPRKYKKQLLGTRKSKSKIKKMISEMKLEGTHKTIYDGFGLNKPAFCPDCGCYHIRWTGNMVEYPELYEKGYCFRCGKLVVMADNSPYYHILTNILKWGTKEFF
jgi:hypothetical protein